MRRRKQALTEADVRKFRLPCPKCGGRLATYAIPSASWTQCHDCGYRDDRPAQRWVGRGRTKAETAEVQEAGQ